MTMKIARIVLSTAIVGVGLVIGLAYPASGQAQTCGATDRFQAIALQPGESVRISVVNPGENPNMTISPVWGIRVRNESGKVVHQTQVTPAPGGVATADFSIPPTGKPGDEDLPPTPNYENLAIEVASVKSAGECASPLAGVQGFDVEGNTSFLLEDRWPPTPWKPTP